MPASLDRPFVGEAKFPPLTFGQGLSSIPNRFLPDEKPKNLALWDGFFKEADRVGNQPEGRVSAEPDRGRTFF